MIRIVTFCWIVLAAALQLEPVFAAPQAAVNPFEAGPVAEPQCPIDRFVFAEWERSGIQKPKLCSDAVFVRRLFLDVIGTLPTAQEAEDFIRDRNAGKRAALIDQVLKREEFTDYWTMKWCDLLRVKAEYPINLWPGAVEVYYRWIRKAVSENMPFDRFARELLTASGSNFRSAQVNFYRAIQGRDPQSIARTAALTFMGARAEKWPSEQLEGLSVFFSQLGFKSTAEWKEEIVYFKPDLPRPESAIFPGGAAVRLQPGRDPRIDFADWLVSTNNPWFSRAMANRAWSWLLGRGIVHEPDDIRADNPPQNPTLLVYLEQELAASRYDIKALFRQILNSQTYQVSSIATDSRADAEAKFARYPLRRLEAETLIDALCQITGATESYSSPIPEPFTFIPEGRRSISLADGSTSSPFLEMFGRPARDTGLESERVNRPSADQRLHLLNSSHIQRKLERNGPLQAILLEKSLPREKLAKLYLTILSRHPTDGELRIARDYSQSPDLKRREAFLDIAWALINSPEFLYRH